MPLVFDLGHRHDRDLAGVVDLVGGKAAHLGVMATELGLPVPPGFVISTAACRAYLAGGWPDGLDEQIRAALRGIEEQVGRRFGDPADPLLVSVRSGAPVSMPGMMDTILNLGLDERTAAGLAAVTGDQAFADDCLSRFRAMYTSVVGVDEVPADPWAQLRGAIEAVFRSWNSERAVAYRAVEGISDELGTAVTVQAMVFGNRGASSGTGVLFTRDPSTGSAAPFGDVMFGAQGEDVVAGSHRTEPIAVLDERAPAVAAELWRYADALERRYADMCDIEFTIEEGTLWMLQVRAGKRSPQAALRMAVDMAEDPAFPLTRDQAVHRVLRHLADPPTTWSGRPGDLAPITRGLPASPGLATGEIVTSPAEAVALAGDGRRVLLVRAETSPEDVPAMAKAAGVLTCRGGLASHAAVVARGWGIPAVVGAEAVRLEDDAVVIDGARYAAGDVLTIDGSTGEVFAGEVAGSETVAPEAETLLAWAAELGIAVPLDEEPAVAAEATSGTGEVADDDVLGWLFIKTISTADALADCLLTTGDVLAPVVERLEEQGVVGRVAGALQLTEAGTARAEQLFRADRERLGEGTADAALDTFVPLDQRMKTTVTAWQMREVDGAQVFNDHSDADYDASVLQALAELHAQARAWLGSLGTAVGRFAAYLARFERAMTAVRAGDHRFVASPRVDSYHSVWFELHEDVIRLAGRTREDEVAAGRA
ncbi:MAG TPA: pyruvate, phosphate dikinase [Blastococcus sp.]|nr:pyruvate, phosphate dikinase [Blastococcus sp.]